MLACGSRAGIIPMVARRNTRSESIYKEGAMRGIKSVFAVCLMGVMLSLVGCNGNSTTSEKAGKDFQDVCAKDELASNAVLYFGPSNQIGPGSIWSRLGPNGGYQPQWRTKDLNLDSPQVVEQGKPSPCDFTKNAKLTTGGGISALSPAANVSAEVKADFQNAKTMKVSAREAAWDTVVAGPYRMQLNKISDPDIKNDVFGKNRLVVRRALRLSGYKAVLEFGRDFAPEIKAKYDGMKLGAKTVGEVGAQFTAKWTKEEKLELSAANDVYVAGEFVEMSNGEFVSTKGEETIQDLGDTWIKPYARFDQ